MHDPEPTVDPLHHPDLVDLARRLRRHLDAVLEAEQAAAAAQARRTAALRDLLLEAEDRRAAISVTTSDGRSRSGQVSSVGADHVRLEPGSVVVVIGHIVALESPQP